MTDQTSSEGGDGRGEHGGTAGTSAADVEDRIAEAEAAIDEARRRLAQAPAEVVVVNHVMGLYELAAIHLSADPPDLRSATLAIDAVAALVEGLGDRLGAESATLRDALTNIRLAFVQIKRRAPSATGAPEEHRPEADHSSAEPPSG